MLASQGFYSNRQAIGRRVGPIREADVHVMTKAATISNVFLETTVTTFSVVKWKLVEYLKISR